MPEFVTHLYDPAVGVCPNICRLDDFEAERVLDRLRGSTRQSLKPNYLARRRATERWLGEAARAAHGREIAATPSYFFLGDFSHAADISRPAALVLPISALPLDAVTFTLGDSMSVAEQPARRVYTLARLAERFVTGDVPAGFGFTDRDGFQELFIEVQLWERYSFGRPLRTRFMS